MKDIVCMRTLWELVIWRMNKALQDFEEEQVFFSGPGLESICDDTPCYFTASLFLLLYL